MKPGKANRNLRYGFIWFILRTNGWGLVHDVNARNRQSRRGTKRARTKENGGRAVPQAKPGKANRK